jgi:hypothetical protein
MSNFTVMHNDTRTTFINNVKSVNSFYMMEYGLILTMFASIVLAFVIIYRYIATAASRCLI